LRFKQLLGETPLEYLTNWRMYKATGLLQEDDKKLFEVAKSVGYDSDAAFSKAFKRILGMPPREYRRRAADGNEVEVGEPRVGGEVSTASSTARNRTSGV
jgi:AraC-like DNA-binding protein